MRLFARVFDAAANAYPWVAVEFNSKGTPIPVKDATSYFVRGTWFDPEKGKNRQQVAPAGKTLDEAVATLARLRALKDGTVIAAAPNLDGGQRRVGTLITQFKTERAALGEAAGTRDAYRKPLERFLTYCKHPYPHQITRQDIVGFISYLRSNVEFRKSSDESQRNKTIRNHLVRVRTFLKWANGKQWEFPLAEREWPKVTKKLPKKYSLRFVTKILEKATEDEKDTILFHLYTGFRKKEVMHAKYSDINFAKGTVNVSDKPEFNWKIKDREHRPKSIKLPKDFVIRLKDRIKRHRASDNDLIFGNSKDRPDYDLLNQIRAIAERSLKGQIHEAKLNNILKEMDLKKFRRTFATVVTKEHGVEEARVLLGHSDIKTTQGYLAAEEIDIDSNEVEQEAAVERMWAPVGD